MHSLMRTKNGNIIKTTLRHQAFFDDDGDVRALEHSGTKSGKTNGAVDDGDGVGRADILGDGVHRRRRAGP